MTVKHILLPLTGEPGSADAAICGMTLAKQLGAHVTAGYQDGMGPLYFGPDMSGAAFTYGIFYEQMQKVRLERKVLARKHFDRAVAATKLPIVSTPVCKQGSAMWFGDRNHEDAPLSIFGALTDLVVLEMPGSRLGPVAWNVVEEALFKAHRAALIIPPGTKSVSFLKPLIAWNGSSEAARAVERVIDLFEPNAKVMVLQIGEIKGGRVPSEQLMDYLGWHCLDAELRRVPDRPDETCQILLDEARRVGADCIVMGAYSHSRTRELLLGGVTEFMLRHALLPVLMAH